MRPCGVYNVSYEQDTAIVRTNLQWFLLIALLVLIFTFPLYGSTYLITIANTLAITIITVLGLNILTGYCGQISLGQAAFMAVGAYTSAILANRFGLPFWVCLPCAGLMAALIGMVFGLPSLRVKGFYLALATLAAQFIIVWLIVTLKDLTGGVEGMSLPFAELGGIIFNSPQKMYFIIMAITVIMTFFAKNLARTKVGRAFVAIRDNDIAAEVLGMNVYYYKLLAFFICSFYAGIAGSLFAYYVAYTTHTAFLLTDSIWYLGMVIIGGLGSTLGSILGAAFLKLLGELVTSITPGLAKSLPWLAGLGAANLGLVVNAIVIALFLIFEPRGLAHRWEVFKTRYRLYPFPY